MKHAHQHVYVYVCVCVCLYSHLHTNIGFQLSNVAARKCVAATIGFGTHVERPESRLIDDLYDRRRTLVKALAASE